MCCVFPGSASHLDCLRLGNAGVGPKVTPNKIQRGPGRYYQDLRQPAEGRSYRVPHSNGGSCLLITPEAVVLNKGGKDRLLIKGGWSQDGWVLVEVFFAMVFYRDASSG